MLTLSRTQILPGDVSNLNLECVSMVQVSCKSSLVPVESYKSEKEMAWGGKYLGRLSVKLVSTLSESLRITDMLWANAQTQTTEEAWIKLQKSPSRSHVLALPKTPDFCSFWIDSTCRPRHQLPSLLRS